MILFLTSVIIVVAMFMEKLFFFGLETRYASSFMGISELVVYFVLLILAVALYLKEFKENFKLKGNRGQDTRNRFSDKFNLLTLFFVVATLGVIFSSFYLNFAKVSIHWDAVALYDARAKFLSGGMKFSDIPSLARYDNLNQYY